jgi:VIT1/CCC1 family predicted Fe2+/Mn2+ transporter
VKKIKGSIAFGIMDGVITLFGILLAMLAVQADQKTILVAAIAAAIADSTANASGFHVSEEANKKSHMAALKSSILCFFATLIVMLIALFPVFIVKPPLSIYMSFALSVLVLFVLGSFIKSWKVGIEYIAIGVFAGIVCYLVGKML